MIQLKEHSFREALQNNQLVMYYQPIIKVENNSVVAAEALVRWNHPVLGFLLPGEFISELEESSIFFDFFVWGLRTACIQNKSWQDQGMAPIRVTVNISVQLLRHPLFVQAIISTLRETGLASNWLELEITETSAMQDVEQSSLTLNQLKDLGIKITVDDFGIGHSSLNYLRNFPVDTIKIDKSFITKSATDKKDLAIIRAICCLADDLGLEVVAEGVETLDQLANLTMLKNCLVQGFLFSEAIPAQAFFEHYQSSFLI
ncbi:MAG: hypothetical protein JWO40_259 [Candidatus Doudnabacteria bacterium]|nr:hypothetical protein [Candidatus Doudnabacteria bacterium]